MTRTDALKALLVTAIAATLVAFSAPEARAHHLPNGYCSESGDLCQSTSKVRGVRLLQIGSAAGYFETYRLCVRGPSGERNCKRFSMEADDGGTYWSTVRWRRHFLSEGAGVYVVTWHALGQRIGARLGFHVR